MWGGTMLKTKDILDEKDKRLRKVSEEVTFPLTDEDKEYIRLMEEYLYNSQIEELAEKYPEGYKGLSSEVYKHMHMIPETFIIDDQPSFSASRKQSKQIRSTPASTSNFSAFNPLLGVLTPWPQANNSH